MELLSIGMSVYSRIGLGLGLKLFRVAWAASDYSGGYTECHDSRRSLRGLCISKQRFSGHLLDLVLSFSAAEF